MVSPDVRLGQLTQPPITQNTFPACPESGESFQNVPSSPCKSSKLKRHVTVSQEVLCVLSFFSQAKSHPLCVPGVQPAPPRCAGAAVSHAQAVERGALGPSCAPRQSPA